jgi:hypothetical protein
MEKEPMKKASCCAVLTLALLAGMTVVSAQALHDEIALTRQEIQTERQAIVAANLQLSDAEAKAFWPLYRAYRQEVSALGDKYVKLLEDYAANYQSLTDEQASKMLDEGLSLIGEENKIMIKHAKKMRQAVPVKTVARFFQIETQLNHMLRLELADQIPLVQNK